MLNIDDNVVILDDEINEEILESVSEKIDEIISNISSLEIIPTLSPKGVIIQAYEDLKIPYCMTCGEIFMNDAFTGETICPINLEGCSKFSN